ncbi:MAG TPA: hypothetical protein PKB10_14335, partial [Tepidisphaeraceae bacterium]|nr:hypothetical protein [Tepidisphaeraceae bacterium]
LVEVSNRVGACRMSIGHEEAVDGHVTVSTTCFVIRVHPRRSAATLDNASNSHQTVRIRRMELET